MVMDDDEITLHIFTRRHSGSSRMTQLKLQLLLLLFAYLFFKHTNFRDFALKLCNFPKENLSPKG